jgi:hypothetical protein
VAERGTLTGGEDRGQPPSLAREAAVERVDAAVDPNEPAVLDAARDRARIEPGGEQLSEPDDTVLARREAGDHRVERGGPTFFSPWVS